MPDLDSIFSSYDADLVSTYYAVREGRMEATFHLVMRGERFDEPLHDRLMDACDGYEDADWHIEVLDSDHDDDWASCTMQIEARTIAACRLLQPRVVQTLPTFQ